MWTLADIYAQGRLFSFSAGIFLLAVSLAVIWDYRPSSLKFWNMTTPQILGLGIFLGFFFGAANTLWWQIMQRLVLTYTNITQPQFQGLGFWLDVPFKGGVAVAGLLHIYARHKHRKELG